MPCSVYNLYPSVDFSKYSMSLLVTSVLARKMASNLYLAKPVTSLSVQTHNNSHVILTPVYKCILALQKMDYST